MHLCLTVECITSGLHLSVFELGHTPPSKGTIVGKNEICRWENLVGPFLVHKLVGPSPPPPVSSDTPPPSPSSYIAGVGVGETPSRCPSDGPAVQQKQRYPQDHAIDAAVPPAAGDVHRQPRRAGGAGHPDGPAAALQPAAAGVRAGDAHGVGGHRRGRCRCGAGARAVG